MNTNMIDNYLPIMFVIPSRIFPIPEIEDWKYPERIFPIPEIETIIFDYLDPVLDLKVVSIFIAITNLRFKKVA